MAYVCYYPATGRYLKGFKLPGWSEKYHSGEIADDVASVFHSGQRRLEPGEAPKKVLLKKQAAKLPDLFSASGGARIITDRVRQILEAFDPGVHQILPIEAFYRDGSKPDTAYFFMNVTKRLDTVIDEASNVEMSWQFSGIKTTERMELSPPSSKDLVLRKEKTAGNNLWREKRYLHLPLLMSDEMHAEFKAQKIKAYHFWRAEER